MPFYVLYFQFNQDTLLLAVYVEFHVSQTACLQCHSLQIGYMHINPFVIRSRGLYVILTGVEYDISRRTTALEFYLSDEIPSGGHIAIIRLQPVGHNGLHTGICQTTEVQYHLVRCTFYGLMRHVIKLYAIFSRIRGITVPVENIFPFRQTGLELRLSAFNAELPQPFTPGRTDLARERPPFHEVRQVRHGDFDRHTLRL